MQMDKILENLLLPDTVCDALLNQEGIYGPFLKLALAVENPEEGVLEDLAEQLQVSPEMLNKAHLSALAWVEDLGV